MLFLWKVLRILNNNNKAFSIYFFFAVLPNTLFLNSLRLTLPTAVFGIESINSISLGTL
jgi:hypothetical protein